MENEFDNGVFLQSSQNNSEENNSNINFDRLDSDIDSDIDIESEERNYYDKLNAENLNWRSIHKEIDLVIIKQGSFLDEFCIICNEEANIRCYDCGPHAFFCNSCNEKNHYKINLFHCQSDKKSPHRIIKKKVRLQPLCRESCNHEIRNITLILLKGK
jgi:hypothetical protein